MTQRPTAPNAIKKVARNALELMAAQAWFVGHLDASISLLQIVLDEAKENGARFPKDADSKDAVKGLTLAKAAMEDVSKRLAAIAVGDK